MVWQCTCGADIDIDLYFSFYYDGDFRCVRKCWGRKEVFDRVEVNGVYSFVQRGLGQLYATLENDIVRWGEPLPPHPLENVGTTTLHVISVEVKTGS